MQNARKPDVSSTHQPTIAASPFDKSRRTALTAAVISAAAVTASSADTGGGGEVDRKALRIECPKDGIVTKIYVGTGGQVEAGKIICEVEPDDEDRALDRVSLAEKLLALEEQLLDPEHVAVRRSIVEQGLTIAKKNSEISQEVIAYYEREADVSHRGRGWPDELAARMSLARSQADEAKVQASLKLFDFNIGQATQRLAMYKDQIKKERGFLGGKKARLVIKAPVAGTFQFVAGEGGFVKKGHLLGVLSQK